MSKIKLTFNVDASLMIGVERLLSILDFEIADGITVTAELGDKLGVSLKDNKAIIYYTKKNEFYRELGILIEHAKKESEFFIIEDNFYTCISAMIDSSRCSVPTVATVKKLLDYMAVMGYSMAMLYTEDTLELEGRLYFGYMRGRYTAEELKAIDDYAYEYGIECIACLELYGHMAAYLKWGEAAAIKDTGSVLLAREEKTFQFVEELIAKVSECFRSRRVHIGMDEAWDMGRGAFLTKHGYVPPYQIFNEYMERLIQITNKYNMVPMMWSDMYFRANTDNNGYYDESIVIPQETIDIIPEEVELIFWHYGEKPYCDDYMLKKHNALGRKVIYAGGLWGWIGHFPEHNYAMDACRFSLNACRNNNVREAMITIWTNDNGECDLFANLFGMSFFTEMCYDNDVKEDKLRARFEACTGGNYDAFYKMADYHNSFTENDDYSANFHSRFLGKPLFWQDIMDGLYDTHLFSKKMSGHYEAAAAKMKEFAADEWGYLYDFAYKVFDYLATKTLIAENLVPSYKNGDKEMLAKIANELLPLLKEKTVAVHEAHKANWFAKYKDLGWAGLDIRYGGMASRCDTAKMTINSYLEGKIDSIGSLEEERLNKPLSGFMGYGGISTPLGHI